MNTQTLDGEVINSRLEDARTYEGVRTRRVFAFIVDYVIVALLCVPFAIIIFLLGVLTLGLGWMLFGALFPAVALLYVWFTLGSRSQATVGMNMMGVRLERLDGRPIDGILALVHTVLFWSANVILTPLILLLPLFLDRKRALHDLLLGTVVTRSDR
ncbi:MAG: RDD family protein [Mesorhizobium sp.]|nr:RDD family protein [Mesorhizobium sp.]